MNRIKMGISLLLLACTTTRATAQTTPPLAGRWSGEATAATDRTRLALNIRSENGKWHANMTLLDVGVMGWPAKSITAGKGFELAFPSDSGDQIMRLNLRTNAQGQPELAGTWSDNRFEKPAKLVLARDAQQVRTTESNVKIKSPGGHLSAAVILPAGAGPHPGTVFLHGAGPQPKDASRFAAHRLAELGIASLIYDKRGVGGSSGQLAGASFQDLADDAIAAAKHLLSLPEISSVGFFGHSQGGWIAPLAANGWDSATFVITSAGPAVPPSREAHWEFVGNLQNLQASDADIASARQTIDHWHHGVRSGDWIKFDAAIATITPKPWFEPSGLSHLPTRPDTAFADSYRAYMDYDPIPTLSSLTVPLLSILAPADESIDALETEKILRGMIKTGSDIRIELYPGFDHSMRSIGSGNLPLRWPRHPSDYFSLQAQFIIQSAQK